MRKLTVVNDRGIVLGMGYMSNDGDAREEIALMELHHQLRESGIIATLVIEDEESVNMDELGRVMAQMA